MVRVDAWRCPNDEVGPQAPSETQHFCSPDAEDNLLVAGNTVFLETDRVFLQMFRCGRLQTLVDPGVDAEVFGGQRRPIVEHMNRPPHRTIGPASR
jgi:hypothetical protein